MIHRPKRGPQQFVTDDLSSKMKSTGERSEGETRLFPPSGAATSARDRDSDVCARIALTPAQKVRDLLLRLPATQSCAMNLTLRLRRLMGLILPYRHSQSVAVCLLLF